MEKTNLTNNIPVVNIDFQSKVNNYLMSGNYIQENQQIQSNNNHLINRVQNHFQ